MAIGGVVINFMAKTAAAVRDVGSLNRKLKDTGDESKTANTRMGKLSSGLKLGLAGGAVAAGAGIAALGGFMVEAGKAALEDKQSSDKLAGTLKKIPGITDDAIGANEDWITSMTLATNVADSDLRVAVGKLTLATGDLKKAQELTKIATDAAAGSGKSLSSITDAMAKAQNGNTASLQRMFPWLDKNKDGTVDLSEAIDGLGGAYEGAAEKAADNDPWTRIQTIWGELKESLGQWLIPLITKFGDWFKNKENQQKIQDFIDKMGDLSAAVGQKLLTKLEAFADWLANPANQKALKDWAQGIGNLVGHINDLLGALKTLKAWTDRLPGNWLAKKLGIIPDFGGGGRPSGGGDFRAAPPPAAPILVSDEQIYRAVYSLLLRGAARNGRGELRIVG